MKLQTINLSGFRSIDNASITKCGGFNVVVGKNNSGKSNILLAVNAFFSCIKNGSPIAIRPPIGRPIDFHKNSTSRPIEIALTFELSLTERDELMRDIVNEAPQLKNAVETLGAEIKATIRVEVKNSDEPFAFVRSITLHNKSANEPSQIIDRNLLSISDSAGAELADNARKARTILQDLESIKQLLSNFDRYAEIYTWERIRMDPSNIIQAASSYAHPIRFSREAETKINSLFRTASNPNEFKQVAQSLMTSLKEESALLQQLPLKNRVDSFSGHEEKVPAYVLNLLKRIGQIKVLYLTERREPIGKREATQLLDLKVKRGGPEKLRYIQQTVSALLGVDIDAFRGESRHSDGEFVAELDVDRFLIQVNGAGVREALRLILDYEFERPDILLVEEPEIHLHPALETSMMRYLKAAGTDSQIFITTHSTNFLDTAEMRNVYLISKKESTAVQQIDANEAESSIPAELGLRLSSLFMFDRLVFVEGPSDQEVIREWASILNVNLANAGVGFIPMGGVRNLAHFAAEKTLAFLSKRRVKIWFIIDRDERDTAEINHLSKTLGPHAKLVVLEKRELENYLINPRAISGLIAKKRELAGAREHSAPPPDDVAKVIDEVAEKLKKIAIDYHVAKESCAPRYVDRRAILEENLDKPIEERLSQEFARVRQQIVELEKQAKALVESKTLALEQNWSVRKLDLIPGDLLLDAVMQRFDLRFKKERDSARLAALMKPEELANELKVFLAELDD